MLIELQKKASISLDYIVDEYNQPREPVKRILEELCTFNKQEREYYLKDANRQ